MVAEHNNEKLTPSTLNTITAATQVGGDIVCLVAGSQCAAVSHLEASTEHLFWVHATVRPVAIGEFHRALAKQKF